MTKAFVLSHPNFSKVFKVPCNALSVGLGGNLRQERHPIMIKSSKSLCNDYKEAKCGISIMIKHSRLLHKPFGI